MNNLRTIIVVQARMQSTRLPGKVLKTFRDGSTILGRILEGLKKLELPVIVATSTEPVDQEIVDWCKKNDIKCNQGPENDVLARFIKVADEEYADAVIRVCADNPFFNFQSIEQLLKKAKDSPNLDYISFRNSSNLPAIKTHWGIYGEWISVKALKKIVETTSDNFYREHVTNFIYEKPRYFNIKWLEADWVIRNRNDLRFTIDNEQDFDVIDELISKIKVQPTLEALIELTDTLPNIKEMMRRNINEYTK